MLTISDLDTAQKLVLWTARAWFAGYASREPVLADLEETYAAMGIAEAAHHADELLGVWVSGHRGCLCIGPADSEVVHAGEARLITVLAAFQLGEPMLAVRGLGTMMKPAEAWLAQVPAASWALRLATARFDIAVINSTYFRHHGTPTQNTAAMPCPVSVDGALRGGGAAVAHASPSPSTHNHHNLSAVSGHAGDVFWLSTRAQPHIDNRQQP
jgi:hypothetical protein